jgi:hypothetical protein
VDAKSNYFCWVVAYINAEFLHLVKGQLAKYPEYDEVEAYIPTIKVLKKQFKGKEQFEEVPLLFNYGFFKIPRKFAIHKNFLEDMQKNVSCIYAWVKDGAKAVNTRVKQSQTDRDIPIATATAEEIADLIRNTINIGAHSAEDLDLLKEGDYITLRGYPWEGSEAIFVGINEKKRKVKVKLILFDQYKELEVSYDNVFFTIYKDKNWDDSITTKDSLDDLKDRKKLDKLTNKLQQNGQDQ